MNKALPVRANRVGIVATDQLRVLGLKAIFNESMQLEIIHLSIPGALDDANLSLVLIDAECTPHLFELIATFRKARPQLNLIVLGNETSQEFVERVIGAGAKGYLALTAKESEIRMAVEMVRDGSVWAPRRVLSRLLDHRRVPASQDAPVPRFTAREIQILNLLRAGQPNREIALTLGIDEGTVKAHIGRLMRKVGVNNRIALTVHPFTQPQ
ncbi:MAG: response regulator transcription factor [Acidobacteriota bacterium]|nr:response regulator transcription factor [Acidobacteriota bacterium]